MSEELININNIEEGVPQEVQEALVIERISQSTGVGKALLDRYKRIVNMYPHWFMDSPYLQFA